MRRREILVSSGASIAVAPVHAGRAQPARMPRIGFLAGRPNPSIAGFDAGLRELGWIDGRNIRIERRMSDGSGGHTRALAAELVALGVDAIYATTTQAAADLRDATTRIPIVFSMLADPVALGWEANFARPSRNLTGVAGVDALEIASKRVEILLDAVPGTRRIGVIHAPGMASSEPALRGSEIAARSLGIELHAVPVDRDSGPEPAFSTLRQWGAQALTVTQSQILGTQPLQGRIVALTMAARLPAIFAESDWVDLGGLMSYGPDMHAMGKRAAWFMDRILRGAKPADLPFERPVRILLRINARTARAMDLTLPLALFARADEVIE